MGCPFLAGVEECDSKPTTEVDAGASQCGGITNYCATDFQLNAPCRILSVSGSISIDASDFDGYTGGNFEWSTTSANISISTPTGNTVTITASNTPSSAKDVEIIKVKRTALDCAPIEKTISVTVAKVTFKKSSLNTYGYDDFDTATNFSDDHICLKKADATNIKVEIEGGLTGTDFNFTCDDTTICTTAAPPGSSSFDLQLNGGLNAGDTVLTAKGNCSDAKIFAGIAVHVYNEAVVEVVVAKFSDSRNGGMKYPTLDYAAFSATANDKLKEAVVKYNIHNFRDDNGVTPISFERTDGLFSWDYGAGSSPDYVAVSNAMSGPNTAGRKRVAIVRQLIAYYRLSEAVKAGPPSPSWFTKVLNGIASIFSSAPAPVPAPVTTLTFAASSTWFTVGQTYPLGTGTTQENITVLSKNANTITCAPTRFDHAIDERMYFPLGGCGADPIIIQEGGADDIETQWTIIHEVGHTNLHLADVEDTDNVMHHQQRATGFTGGRRLRICPRTLKYPDIYTAQHPDGKQIQWKDIPR